MITSPARGSDRVAGASEPPPSALSTSTALVILLLVALALRLTIAYILFPASGFASDVSTYVSWAMTMAHGGPGAFYADAGFIDYPPGYLYVLWPIGVLSQALGGSDPYGLATTLIKVPPMLVDIAVGWLLYRLVLGWAWPSRRAEALALGAAGLYVFNPVTWYDSALWGQTDAVGALVVLMGVAALVRGNSEGAASLGVLAALVKPQFGVVLLPVIAVVLLRRHVLRPGSGPRHAPWGPAMLQGWLAREQGWPRLVSSAAVALVTFHVLALPFGMGIPDYLGLMSRTAGGYEYLTVNAYNPWALVSADGTTPLAFSMPLWQGDVEPWIGPLPPVAIGAALLVAGFLYGLGNLLWRDERRTIILTAVFLAICFFVLPTRVHERYLVPVFALLPLLAVASRAWLVALVALATACLINLHGVLTYAPNPDFRYGTDNVANMAFGDAARSPLLVVLSVLLVTGGFLFTAWRLWRGGVREPDGLALAAATVGGTVDPGPLPGETRTSWWARGIGVSAAAGADGTGEHPELVRGPGAFTWIVDRITPRPLRRDRSPSLAGEPPGRLDRLDLLMVVMILVSAATLRGYRVQEPYDMYFDEVYHARTAMEFLQDWRYDDPHDIFEWTHPHLAKYAMAVGIEVFGDHRVTGESELGTPVVAAAIEPRWAPGEAPGERRGDRLYVLTGSSIDVYDLATRDRIASTPSTATALAVDGGNHRLVLAAPDGTLSTLDTTLLDAGPDGSGQVGSTTTLLDPVQQSTLGPVDPAWIAIDRRAVVIAGTGGDLVSLDPDTGARLGRTILPGVRDLEVVPRASAVVARPAEVEDPPGTARVLADELGLSAATLETLLRSDADEVVLEGWPDITLENRIQELMDDGTLLGVSIEDVPVVAAATPDGVRFLVATSLDTMGDVSLDEGATGLAWVPDGPDTNTLYVAAGSVLERIAMDGKTPRGGGATDMPGPVTGVIWNDAADLLHVLGELADGRPTIYVVDPHGHSVFMDVPLPSAPVALVMDTQEDRPSEDRTQILALGNDGSVASVDVGGNAFGYRMPGVLMGAITAAAIYLLARVLFRRRSIGLFAAALALAEGMLFANARIAMNDVYITGFLVLAAALFAPIWLGTWRRWWQVVLVVPLVGVLLGLALASKWVAAYAIGGVLLLILLRSGIGRLIALAGMVALTGVLGALAIRPAAVEEPHRNWPFLLILLLLTLALAAAMVRRPLPVTRAQVWSAVTWLVIAGLGAVGLWLLATLRTPEGSSTGSTLLIAGGVSILGASVLGIGTLILGRLGHGPFRPDDGSHPTPTTDASLPAWLDPGRGLGLWWVLTIGCLVVVPVAVYVASYIPWFALGNQLWKGVPDGNTGQTLWDLTVQMYGYHDHLRATHAASSPWWAWPLDLKPVWFYQQSFAGGTLGEIYDTGNLVIFWMGIPALIFGTIAAWRRRSLSMTLVVLLFLAMWLPWARIDRATFQYHYYTTLPFLVLALAYLLAELWHGPARIGWLIARVGGALCVIGAPLLWLLRQPLCLAADVQSVKAGSQACGAAARDVTLSQQTLGILAVLVLAGVATGLYLWQGSGRSGGRTPELDEDVETERGGRLGRALGGLMDGPAAGLVVIGAATLLALVAAVALLSDADRLTFQVTADELSLLALALLAGPAWLVLRARDARRFALGVVVAAFLFLLIWYPNLTGLPLPDGLATSFQGLLPTWNYDFQFGVNQDPPVPGGFLDLASAVVAMVTLLLTGVVMLVARRWRSGPAHPLLDDLR